MRTMTMAAGAVALGLAAFGATVPMAQANDDGTVTVIHGIPGLDVDVYVNGEKTLPNFTPGTVTDPLTLPAGDYEIDIYAAGDGPDDANGEAAISDTVALPAGANASVVAYLTEAGTPSADLAVFVNDVSAVAAGEARVTVRHVAAAPAVSVSADGSTLIETLSNPDEASADVPAKSYAVAVAPAAGGDAVFETDLDLPEGESTIVYAYGNLTADPSTFAVAVQSIDGLGSAPTGVPAGEGPGTLPTSGGPLWLVAIVAAALAAGAWSTRRLMTARG